MQNKTFEASLSLVYSLARPSYFQVYVPAAEFGCAGDQLTFRLRFTESSMVNIISGEQRHLMSAEQLFGLVTCHQGCQNLLAEKIPLSPLHPLMALLTASRIRWDKQSPHWDGVATVQELGLGSSIISLFPQRAADENLATRNWRYRVWRHCVRQLQRSGIPVSNQ